MKIKDCLIRRVSLCIIVVTVFTSCTFPPKPAQYTGFYVSIKGDDVTGNGTKAKPWCHIQYAIDKASAKGGTTLRINVLRGSHQEWLVIHKPLVLKGVGAGKSTTWPNDPFYPLEEVSIIEVGGDYGNHRILIENAACITLRDLMVTSGGTRALDTCLIMYNLEIPLSRGGSLSAVQIESCPFFHIKYLKEGQLLM